MNGNAWMFRPNIDEKKIEELESKDLIACGWPHLGDLSGLSKEEIKMLLQKPPYEYSKIKLGNASSALDIFVNQMKKYDLVLMPKGKFVLIGNVQGDYTYDPTVDNDTDGYPHQRLIEWNIRVERVNLPIELRQSLKAHQVATSLTKFYDIIDLLVRVDNNEFLGDDDTMESVTVSYPLRPDYAVSFAVPIDISEREAERLSDFCLTLDFGRTLDVLWFELNTLRAKLYAKSQGDKFKCVSEMKNESYAQKEERAKHQEWLEKMLVEVEELETIIENEKILSKNERTEFEERIKRLEKERIKRLEKERKSLK